MMPCPYLRKTVAITKPIRQARLYVTALGVYEMRLNGQRVSDDLFNPQWTDYHRRVQYHTYDVTRLLRRGDNALGLILGDGWYAGFVGLGGRCRYGRLPLALAQLEIEHTDGTRETLCTEASWKAATGPLRQSDMLMGEVYDARQELAGWARPDFDDQRWQPVCVKTPTVHLVAAADDPVRKTQELIARSVTEPSPGCFVFDLGQNIVGVPRLKVRGQAGREIRLRFGEMLNPDGTLYVQNLREARCLDRYHPRGNGEETYEPHFTFHGFRYVEVTGCAGRLAPDAITGLVLHSDAPVAGRFECSNPLVSQLQRNIFWGQRGNFLSIPTDCPQRDERLGWTGDAQVFLPTAVYNMDLARFFTKWCQDVEDAQQPTGAFTDVVPSVAATNGTAAWGDAGVICPWTLYQVYGDTRLLERHYAAGAKWIEYLRQNSTALLRPARGYGDWLSIEADTPKDLLATAYFARSAWLMARLAEILKKPADARQYHDLFERIRVAFNTEFVTPDGHLKGQTQTAYLLALEFDLLPDTLRAAATRYLLEDLEKKDHHLSTGFVGVGLLLPALTRAGHSDVAYRLLTQDTFPSWLYSIKQGATTIWERWDGWTKERGFQTPWMNSFNHYSLGSVGAWLFESVAGLGFDPKHPGFRRLVIHPHLGGDLTWARAEYNSISGWILSYWRIEDQTLKLDVTLPANTAAQVHLPTTDPSRVLESGRPLSRVKGVQSATKQGQETLLDIGSGVYRFAVPLPR